jgi:hypothetical protein
LKKTAGRPPVSPTNPAADMNATKFARALVTAPEIGEPAGACASGWMLPLLLLRK